MSEYVGIQMCEYVMLTDIYISNCNLNLFSKPPASSHLHPQQSDHSCSEFHKLHKNQSKVQPFKMSAEVKNINLKSSPENLSLPHLNSSFFWSWVASGSCVAVIP